MGGFKMLIFLLLGFVCVVNSNPLLNFFGKGDDDKAEVDDKTTISTPSTAKAAADTTTTTTTTTTTAAPDPGSSCGGLKGFLHICDKTEQTEPPKSVKTRSVPEEGDNSDEDSDEDNDSVDDNDDDDSDEEQKQENNTPSVDDAPEGKIEKRQAEDTEAPPTEAVPIPPADPAFYTALKKRQADDDSEDESEPNENTTENGSRKRRDCRDREGDYGKDCRRKRELVPCADPRCREREATTISPDNN